MRVTNGDVVEIYFKLWTDKGRPFSVKSAFLQTKERSLATLVAGYRSYLGKLEFNGFFLGAITFAMLFFIFIFFKVKDPVFLLYAIYLFGAAVYALVVKTLPYSQVAKLVNLNYPLTYKLGEPVQFLFFAAYLGFGKVLLCINSSQKWLNRVILGCIALLFISGVSLLIVNFLYFNFQLQERIYVFSRILILPMSIGLLIWISLVVTNHVKWFFIVGSSFFILGGLVTVLVDPKSRHLFFGWETISSVVFFKTGILLEGLCFAFALGYKIRVTQREKEKALQDYIEQLLVNKKMAATEKERLEAMVEERTFEVVEKTRVIENQRQQHIRLDLERQLSEMEMKALRSQMNPHFIFNSLNSIRYQILKEDYDNAATYLTRFARFLRNLLQHSREHVISLAEELEMNRLYLQLESLRFQDGFTFYISVAPEVDPSEIVIPSMLLQPYVENAVKHGLIPRNDKRKKKLEIRVTSTDNGYAIIIEDNGIGRKATVAEAVSESRESLGMKIASERIALFNYRFLPTLAMSVEDLYVKDVPAGTRVTISYKS